ncbi:MAG: cysteine peptidase family C39 domain-containing protein [Armatimonadota bacterium]
MVLHKMLAFESLFKDSMVKYKDLESGNEFALYLAGADEALVTHGNTIASLSHGLLSRRSIDNEDKPIVSIAYGSSIATSVRAMSADLHALLFWLGARVSGDLNMSDAFQSAKDAHVTKTDQFLIISFSTPDDSKFSISWREDMVCPEKLSIGSIKYEYSRPKGHSWPVTIGLTISGKHGGKLEVSEPIELLKRPPLIEIQNGSVVYDEHYNLRYVQEEASSISAESASEVIKRCLAKETKLVTGNQRKMLCGLDCVYYLSKMMNRPIEYRLLLEDLPDAKTRGATLEELQSLALAHGLKSKGYAVSWQELKDLKKYAILSWRPSHFVLYVPESGGIISPPYSTDMPDAQRALALYTGTALIFE